MLAPENEGHATTSIREQLGRFRCQDRRVTEEEIHRVCEKWVRGEHFPVQDADEERLRARLGEDPEL
ncbi:MAG: hypothetical protein LC749_06340 [Actinobacteria bacterium]|nr:hypothetical protein [Actinomycetota bacterium]